MAAVGVEGAIVPARPAEVRATRTGGRSSPEAVAITAQVLARRRGGASVLVIEPLTEVMTPLGRRGPGHFLYVRRWRRISHHRKLIKDISRP